MRFSPTLRKLMKGLAVAATILVLLELILRLAGDPGPLRRRNLFPEGGWYVYSEILRWGRKPGYSGFVYGVGRTFDTDGFLAIDTPKIHDRTRRKIVAIGDSVTFGYGVSAEEAFPERLDRSLPGTSVINLGLPGYSSYQGLQVLLEQGLPLRPSVAIIQFNFNDRRSVLRKQDMDSAPAFRRTARVHGLQVFMEEISLYRGFRALLWAAGLKGSGSKPVDVEALHVRVPPDRYGASLRRMVRIAKQNGIQPIFLLTGDNPLQSRTLREGIDRLGWGLYAPAQEKLEAAIERNDMFSDLARIYFVQACRKSGGRVGCERVSHVRMTMPEMSLAGGRLLRRDKEYGDIMRRVASEEGVPLVDAKRALDEQPDVYIDFAHFNARGHEETARLLRAAILKLPVRARPEPPRAPR